MAAEAFGVEERRAEPVFGKAGLGARDGRWIFGEGYGARHQRFPVGQDEVRQTDGGEQTFRNAGGKVAPLLGDDRQAGPELVGGRGVAVIGGGVEAEIGCLEAGDVGRIIAFRREMDALCRNPAPLQRGEDVLARERTVDHDPEHGAGRAAQDLRPGLKGLQGNLALGVEAREDEAIGGQPQIVTRRSGGKDAMHRIVRLVAFRQAADLLVIVRLRGGRQHDRIADDIVEIDADRGAGKAEPGDLHRCGAVIQNAAARAACEALEVDQDVDAVAPDRFRGFRIAHRADRHDLSPAVAPAGVEADEALRRVAVEHRLDAA